MVGQSESDDIFVYGVKAKELMITGPSVLFLPISLENKNVYLFTMGFLIFGIQIKILGDLLCPTILILPHPTLSIGILFFQGRPGILHPPSCMDIKWSSPVYLKTRALRRKTIMNISSHFKERVKNEHKFLFPDSV